MTRFVSFADERPQAFHARFSRRAVPIAARRRTRHRGRRLAALAVAVAVPAFAAPNDWQAFSPAAHALAETRAQAETIIPMAFETPGDSFPGSAFYYLADGPAMPRAALSDPLAPDAHWDAEAAIVIPDPGSASMADARTGPAARPLIANGTGASQGRALRCLTQAIYYEAASESHAGQRAVAQVVLNRVAHKTYPNSVCGVVFQGSARRTGCQFSFTCDGSLARRPSRTAWGRARIVANAALSGAVFARVGLATHYHTTKIHPYWADSLVKISTIGAHRFYRRGGQAGRSAAFRTNYSGSEPALSTKSHGNTPTNSTIAITRAAVPAKSAGTLAPAYGSPASPDTPSSQYGTNRLPQSGGVRPEYVQSGQWIKKPN